MSKQGKLMDMLTGYAAAHQHPANIFVHMIGIPTIMLGVMIPLTWVGIEIGGWHFYLAHVVLLGFFLFYLTLDMVFAVVFLAAGILMVELAAHLGSVPGNSGWVIAAGCFFGGYLAQFIGHAIEKSTPVLVRHPVQASLAAPFFTVVELFNILGLRRALFDKVQQQVQQRRASNDTA